MLGGTAVRLIPCGIHIMAMEAADTVGSTTVGTRRVSLLYNREYLVKYDPRVTVVMIVSSKYDSTSTRGNRAGRDGCTLAPVPHTWRWKQRIQSEVGTREVSRLGRVSGKM